MTYQALGPVAVVGESGELSLGGENQRRLLAVLLAHRDREGDVRVTNPDSTSVVLAGGFTITLG